MWNARARAELVPCVCCLGWPRRGSITSFDGMTQLSATRHAPGSTVKWFGTSRRPFMPSFVPPIRRPTRSGAANRESGSSQER
jgi:hypothetical protein